MSLALLFLATSQAFNLPPGLLSAVCFVESSHRVNVIHHDDGSGDSIGLCQIKYTTAIQMGYKGDANGLKDPKVNAFWAASFMAHQYMRYRGDVVKAISAYNAGSYRLNEKGEIKNRRYVAKVFKAWNEGR